MPGGALKATFFLSSASTKETNDRKRKAANKKQERTIFNELFICILKIRN
jgi:hypothetical protein